jgi:hypothetical protein
VLVFPWPSDPLSPEPGHNHKVVCDEAPAFAQQKDMVDPKIAEQIRAVLLNDETFNKHGTASFAALFTEDGVLYSATDGTFHGRQAIEKYEEDSYQRWHPSEFVHAVDQIIAVGNDVRAVGKSGVLSCFVPNRPGQSRTSAPPCSDLR